MWEKKGLTLVQKRLRCHCGLGLMIRDNDFYKKQETANGISTVVSNTIITNKTETIAANASSEIRNKKKKKKELPRLNFGYNIAIPPNENAELYK